MTPQDLYFLLHTGNEGDAEFYAARARAANCVLEVGCGDGRILQHLLGPGREVVGIDVEPAFVERARDALLSATQPAGSSSRVELADARTAALLPGHFDCILIPYNTIYALGGANGVRACARRCHAAATGEGMLWLDVYPVDDFHEMALAELPPEDDDEPLIELTGPGGHYSVTETTELAPTSQHLEATYRATPEVGPAVELTLQHDYLLLDELEELFAAEGWRRVYRGSGFAQSAPSLSERPSPPGSDWQSEASQRDPLSDGRPDEPETEQAQWVLGFRKVGTPQPG